MILLDYVVKLGLSIGLILLNVGILIWVIGSVNNQDDRIAIDIIYGSLMLLILSLFLYAR